MSDQTMAGLRSRLTSLGEHASLWKGLGLFILAIVVLYYPIGMLMVHKVDDDLNFSPAEATEPNQSHAVTVAAALIDRETRVYSWTANEPFFMPASALDNMPNFQQGIIHGVSRFAIEMADQIGRTRGSSAVDADLEKAAGLLKYPGNVWMWDPSTSWAPTAPSERQYQAAERALVSYNQRLAAGQAAFERRADNLQATLDRVSKDLGSQSAVIDAYVVESDWPLFKFTADDVFYGNKGRLYAYALLMKALGADFAGLIAERELSGAWEQMVASLNSAAALDPLIVVSASPDSMILPSHLTAQGFYLLRARTQLTEIISILAK